MSAVSLADVEAHLQQTVASNAELQRFIDAAESAISLRAGPLTPVTTVDKLNGGGQILVLKQPRAVSLTSITYADGTTSTLSDYDLDPDTGIVYWNYGTVGRFAAGTGRNVTVTYQAGFATLPEDLKHAVKELVRHLWQTQRGSNTSRPGFEDEQVIVGAYASWPTRVRELVDPYTCPRVGG